MARAMATIAVATSGGPRVQISAKRTTSPPVFWRATKNAGFLPRRSNSGWTKASVHSAPRCSAQKRRLGQPGLSVDFIQRPRGELEAIADGEELLEGGLERL